MSLIYDPDMHDGCHELFQLECSRHKTMKISEQHLEATETAAELTVLDEEEMSGGSSG